jgi:hypothetical protein
MFRISVLLCAVTFACGGTSKPAPTAPLPAEPTPAVAQPATPAPTPEAPKEEPPPAEPVSLVLEPQTVQVKLVSAGKGAKTMLAYAPKTGVKQPVELAIDFFGKQSAAAELGGDQESGMPTLVFTGDAEAKTAGKDGADVVFTVTKTDARAVAGRDQVPLEKVEQLVAGATGMTMSGKVAPNGTAVGETKLELEKGLPGAREVMQIIQVANPTWPVLPAKAVGVGAKWKATTTTKLMGKVNATVVTDYQVVAKKGSTWTIKGKTKLTGADQEIDKAKFSSITGTGDVEATIVDGSLYPTFTSKLDASLQAAVDAGTIKFTMQIGTAVTAGEAK